MKVQLGFAAEFSNVMVIYTRILEKPKEISSCCAQLTDFPEVCELILELRFKGDICMGALLSHKLVRLVQSNTKVNCRNKRELKYSPVRAD